MRSIIFISLLFVFTSHAFAKKPYVLMISIDGYRYDYTEKFKPKNISQYFKDGAVADSLQPIFPSLTFPNHYSIATGRYAENSGIVSNWFYDPDTEKEYRLGSKSVYDASFYKGMPLWLVANENGLKSATMFWVGSDVKIHNQYPTYHRKYEHGLPLQDRVDQVLEWLSLPEGERPHFLSLYFHHVDKAAHYNGPDSEAVQQAVFQVDEALGYLFNQLDQMQLPVNVILLSDHGMQTVDTKSLVNLNDYVDLKQFKSAGQGALIHFYEKNNKQQLMQQLEKIPFSKVYLREDLPERFHYKKLSRIGDVVLLADIGHFIISEPRVAKKVVGLKKPSSHGWDPVHKQMHGIFYAKGPNIKPLKVQTFENIHIYPLVLKILDMQTDVPFDGDYEVLKELYNSSQ